MYWRGSQYEKTGDRTSPASDKESYAEVTRFQTKKHYNNGFAKGIDSNHRITSNFAAYQQTIAAGSIGEGVVMCAPPSVANATLLLSPDGTTVYDIANNIS